MKYLTSVATGVALAVAISALVVFFISQSMQADARKRAAFALKYPRSGVYTYSMEEVD
jgi:hypothetical protein